LQTAEHLTINTHNHLAFLLHEEDKKYALYHAQALIVANVIVVVFALIFVLILNYLRQKNFTSFCYNCRLFLVHVKITCVLQKKSVFPNLPSPEQGISV